MADFDTSYKRKYEDESPSPPWRSTSCSPPLVSNAPRFQNTVPLPPPPEFQVFKQKVGEIASRALNADSKRSKFCNGGFNQHQVGNGVSTPALSYSSSKIIEVPNGRVGAIIGKAGETIKYLENQSGARIQITRDAEHDPNMPNRTVELMGDQDQIAKAEHMIYEVLAEADSGGSGSMLRRPSGATGSEPFVMTVPNNKVGLVIGKGGETIKNIQARSGARVQVIPSHLPPGDTSSERTVQIDGTSEQIEFAKQLVNEVIENRQQNQAMSGGYPQQGYQAQPQANWAHQPPQMQQTTGYDYTQQQQWGANPGAPSLYMSHPPYSGYPPQPTLAGYTQNWDPSNASQTQQVPPQGTGYEYYGQQAPPQQQPSSGPMTGTTGYEYNQSSSGGYGQQGYSQVGYGGGYNVPHAQSGYEQQQSYGTNPPQEGHPPLYGTQGETGHGPSSGQQGYTGQPSPNPTYPTQGSNQAGYGGSGPVQGGYGPGYGLSQGQRTPNPPAYGQPEQSPSQGGGYTQPGYPAAPSGYGQQDAGASRAVASSPGSYGGATSQSIAYPPPYGAPAVTAPSYGQPPPAYYSGATPAPAPAPAPSSQPAGQSSGVIQTSP